MAWWDNLRSSVETFGRQAAKNVAQREPQAAAATRPRPAPAVRPSSDWARPLPQRQAPARLGGPAGGMSVPVTRSLPTTVPQRQEQSVLDRIVRGGSVMADMFSNAVQTSANPTGAALQAADSDQARDRRQELARMQILRTADINSARADRAEQRRDRRQVVADAQARAARQMGVGTSSTVKEPGSTEYEQRQSQQQESLRQWRSGGARPSGQGNTAETQLGLTRRLTPSEFNRLSPRQQAAVEFNTGLVSAHESGEEGVRRYLTQLGLEEPSEEEMDSFLQLDRLITESVLEKLDDVQTTQQSAESLRWARGGPGAENSRRHSDALSSANLAAELMADLMRARGQQGLEASTRPAREGAGWSETPRDQVIRNAWYTMADASYDMDWEDVVAGVNMLNAEAGTDVDPTEVANFARMQLSSQEFDTAGGRTPRLDIPAVNPFTELEIIPMEAAQIRRRYGL